MFPEFCLFNLTFPCVDLNDSRVICEMFTDSNISEKKTKYILDL